MRDIFKFLQEAQQMQGKLQQIQNDLQQRTVTGAAGGGMVTVEADGRGQIKRVKIDPASVNAGDLEMLEDLIVVAVADAQKKAAELAQQEMAKLTGGLDLPFKLPFA
jgi:DNA-binding YbaB/EbfC family protein